MDDDEDKEILESIKYAENKLGTKMKTPHALPKEHPFAPIKYDVEEENPAKDMKLMKKNVAALAVSGSGDCDAEDGECRKDSV